MLTPPSRTTHLYGKTGFAVLTPRGPGRLWQAGNDRVGVILDAAPEKVAFFEDPKDVLIDPAREQEQLEQESTVPDGAVFWRLSAEGKTPAESKPGGRRSGHASRGKLGPRIRPRRKRRRQGP